MASRDERLFVSHLFVAAPELLWEDIFIDYLQDKGYITESGMGFILRMRRDKKRLQTIQRRMKNQSLFNRLVAIAPEIINRKTLGILRSLGMMGKEDEYRMRVYLGILERGGKGGLPGDIRTAILRARRMFGLGFAEDMLSLLHATDQLTQQEVNFLRADLLAGRAATETLQNVLKAKGLVEALQMVGSGLVDRKTIEALRLSGLVYGRTANAMLEALVYGKSQWRVFEGAKRAEGLAARMAYMVSGAFNFEMVEFLRTLGVLKPEQLALLKIATSLSQEFNRKMMEDLTERRFRVRPGEAPIVSYARAAKETDAALLRLLADAADDARSRAQALAARGAAARGAEYSLRARALHQSMRQLWEGVGYLTIFGEKKVADAAISASELLQSRYYSNMSPFARLMMEYQARSGLDSYISRRENTLALSNRVYGNLNLWTKKVDKEISIGLLQGQSAKEIGERVQTLINPKVMGGVRYAAMRLGRTELANAFHTTTIRHTREMPWVRAYKWNRSSSHKHADVCDDYARNDHSGLGPGVFKKANVPGKPHPQCLCYLTVVGMSEDEFVKAYKAGRFNSYFKTKVREPDVKERMLRESLLLAAKGGGRIAAKVAISKGMGAAETEMWDGALLLGGFDDEN